MSVATLPETTEDQDLEAWLNHEIEIPCEVFHSIGFLGTSPCDNPAEWVVYRKPCVCGEAAASKYVCARAYRSFSTGDTICGGSGGTCLEQVEVTWIERIKK